MKVLTLKPIDLLSNIVTLISIIWHWLHTGCMVDTGCMVFPEISFLDLYCIFSKNRNYLSLLYAGNCVMSFYVDLETLKLYIFSLRQKFYFQWYVMWLLLKKVFLKALFLAWKIEGHKCCSIYPPKLPKAIRVTPTWFGVSGLCQRYLCKKTSRILILSVTQKFSTFLLD